MAPDGDIPNEPAASRRLLTRFDEYIRAYAELVRNASRELRLFDPDARQLELGSSARIDLLFQFLRGAPTRRLWLAVHDTRHLATECPLFLRLLGQFAAQMEVRVTCGEARRAEDCFLVADAAHVLRRAVAAQPRGALYEHDPATAATQRERFEQIWVATEPGLTPGPLGLS